MCCGKKRTELQQTTQIPAPLNVGEKVEEKVIEQIDLPESDNKVYFQYRGNTGLTVIGPISRKRYRFDSPGAILNIDPSDKRALAGVSVLKQVRTA